MDEYDRENLNFLMTVGAAGLREWYSQASQDDIEYAQELLSYHEFELNIAKHGVAFVQQNSTVH